MRYSGQDKFKRKEPFTGVVVWRLSLEFQLFWQREGHRLGFFPFFTLSSLLPPAGSETEMLLILREMAYIPLVHN